MIHTEVEFVADDRPLKGWVILDEGYFLHVKVSCGVNCGDVYEISPDDIVDPHDNDECFSKTHYWYDEE